MATCAVPIGDAFQSANKANESCKSESASPTARPQSGSAEKPQQNLIKRRIGEMTAAAPAIAKVGLGHANVAARAFGDKQRNRFHGTCIAIIVITRSASTPGVRRASTTMQTIYFRPRPATALPNRRSDIKITKNRARIPLSSRTRPIVRSVRLVKIVPLVQLIDAQLFREIEGTQIDEKRTAETNCSYIYLKMPFIGRFRSTETDRRKGEKPISAAINQLRSWFYFDRANDGRTLSKTDDRRLPRNNKKRLNFHNASAAQTKTFRNQSGLSSAGQQPRE